jgi:uncharacterized membrane protein YbhN (UPF0104 family)
MPPRPAASPALRRWAIRAGGSAVLLGALFWMLPRDAILEGFQRIPLHLFALVMVLFIFGHVVAALKWWNVLHRSLPFPVALRAHFAGLAANLCLPGAAGGDTVRAAVGYAHLRDFGVIGAAATADRLIDMVALASLTVAGLIVAGGDGAGWASTEAACGLILLIALGAFYVFPWLVPQVWSRFPRLPGRGPAQNLAVGLARLARAPGLLLVNLVLSIAIQAGFIWLNFLFARAVGLEVPIAAWAFAWALSKIISVLPVSLGGLGLREASLAALLAPFGAVPALVVTAGLAWQVVLFLTGGLGALVLFLTGARLRPATPGE